MSEAHAEHDEHSPAHYGKIAVILIGLAFVSYVGPMLGIKSLTLITAFGIALIKAYLVIKHFMHLTIEKVYVKSMLLTAVVFMFLFFAGTSADVMNHRGRNWENVGAQSEVKRALEAPPVEHGAHGGAHESHEGHEGHEVHH